MNTTTTLEAKFVVFSTEATASSSTTQLFANEIDGLIYTIQQNRQYEYGNPFVMKKLVDF
jgi:hypothetical protein